MDSLPTGSTQSWLIVAAIAFSPVIVLVLADPIGWLFRQARGKGEKLPSFPVNLQHPPARHQESPLRRVWVGTPLSFAYNQSECSFIHI